MEAARNRTHGRFPYREIDVLAIPGDVPEHGIKAGDGGEIHALDLRGNGNEVVALVRVPYSTGQTRCWLEVNVRPGRRILSYSTP